MAPMIPILQAWSRAKAVLSPAFLAFWAYGAAACGTQDPGLPMRSQLPSTANPGLGDDARKAPPAVIPPLEQDEGYDDLGEGSGETSQEELAQQCGGIDLNNPQAELVNAGLRSLPIVTRGTRRIIGVIPINYEIIALADLQIRANLESSVTTTAFNVTATPRLAQNTAENEAGQRAGTTTTEFLLASERANLSDTVPDWSGILCTVQPGTRITSAMGAGQVSASFDPPFPSSISPRADLQRYALELPAARTWTGVTALIEASDNPAVLAGSSYTGTVSLNPIAPAFTVTSQDGTLQTVSADIAFELVADFGSPEITAALGLKPSTKFYIDTAARAYKAIIADVKDGTTPPAVFISP